MNERLGNLTVYLNADTERYEKGMKRAQGLLMGFAKRWAGPAGLAAFATSAAKAWGEQEEALAKLGKALTQQGAFSEKAVSNLNDFAGGLARVTEYGDDQIVTMMALGLNVGVTAGRIREATEAAIGLAAKLGIDLETSMRLVAKAAVGNVSTFSRYGLTIDQNLSTQEKFNRAVEVGRKNFYLAGQDTNTINGSFRRAKKEVGELFEAFGKLFFQDWLTTDIKTLGDGIIWLTDKIGKLADVTHGWASSFQSAVEGWAAEMMVSWGSSGNLGSAENIERRRYLREMRAAEKAKGPAGFAKPSAFTPGAGLGVSAGIKTVPLAGAAVRGSVEAYRAEVTRLDKTAQPLNRIAALMEKQVAATNKTAVNTDEMKKAITAGSASAGFAGVTIGAVDFR